MFKKVCLLVMPVLTALFTFCPYCRAEAHADSYMTAGYAIFLDRLNSDPNTAVEVNQANAYLRRGAVNEAIKIYENILVPVTAEPDPDKFPPPPKAEPIDKKAQLYLSARLGYANALIKTGKDDQALKNYDEAVRIKPGIIIYYLKLGSSMLQYGRIDTAEKIFDRYLLFEPDNISANAGLGTVNFTRENYEKSLQYFSKAKAADPNDSAVRHSLAAVLIKLDRLNQASDELQAAIEINPQNYAAAVMLAANYKALEKPIEAIEQYKRVLAGDPNIPAAAYGLGVLKLEDRYEPYYEPYEAFQYLLQACQLTDFSRADYLDTLAVAAYETGRYDLAIEYETLALEIHKAAGNESAAEKAKERIEFYSKAITLQNNPNKADPNQNTSDNR